MKNSYLKKLQKKRIAQDRRVATLITLGGWLILVTLLLMIWHLLSVTWPLLGSPEIKKTGEWTLPKNSAFVAAGNIKEQEFLIWREANCQLKIGQFIDGEWRATRRILRDCDANVQFAIESGGIFIADILPDARFRILYHDPFNTLSELSPVMSGRLPFSETSDLIDWQLIPLAQSFLLTAKDKEGRIQIGSFNRNTFQLEYSHRLSANTPVSVMAPSNQLIAYDNGGFLKINHIIEPIQVQIPMSTPQRIFALPSGNAFLTLDADGQLSKWSFVRVGSSPQLKNLYRLNVPYVVEQVILTPESQLVLLVGQGQVAFLNTTTGEVVNQTTLTQLKGALVSVSDHHVSLVTGGVVSQWELVNATAVTTFSSLWREVWYDGYSEPEYVWQTSSALDAHQAKYSIVPLFIGSMKAALLAVIVAIPVGIGCAIYVGYFARQHTRKYLKPTIELIEGIPSVVIGFIAAIWLLPIADVYLMALFLFLLVSPIFLALFCIIRVKIGNRWQRGWELIFVTLVLGVYILSFDSFVANQTAIMQWFWTDNVLTEAFVYGSAKNTMILAIALGFAIAPTVFSIAEDAINEVPRGLLLASFAMGANQVQTLQRVVLKAALPGVLSAIMLGFARALGETMIVLMVSGNTPIADWSLVEGVRTFTANLAIELPEAEVGGIHYQILFLTALLLFAFTFVVNTLAELLRQKLRVRHSNA